MSKMNWKKVIGWGVAALVVIGVVWHNALEVSKSNAHKIMGFVPLTGKLASAGISEGRGVEIVVDDWNQKGGLLGQKIEAVLEDTRADTTETTTIYQRNNISENKPLAIYSIVSGVAMNLKNFTEKDSIPHIAAVGAENFSKDPHSYSLRNFDSANIVGKELMHHVKSTYPNRRIVYFYENSDHSISCKAAMEKEMTSDMNVKVLDFDPTMNNFRDLILKANPNNEQDVVIITGIGSYLGILIRQLREFGYTGPIMGDANLNIAGVHNYAEKAMNGVIILDYQQYDKNAYCQHLNEAFIKKYGEPLPDVGYYLAYQGIDTLLAFYEKMGTTDIPNLAKAMEGFEHDGCLGKVTVKDGELNYPLSFRTVTE